METLFIVLIALFFIIFGLLLYFLYIKLNKMPGKPEIGDVFNDSMQDLRQSINTFYQELGAIKEIGRKMESLQDFLRSPKLRGNIGEEVLKDLLRQNFSKKHFSLQYKFDDGKIIDAIIKTKQGIIPIDSKFPMGVFNQMVKAEGDEKSSFEKKFVREVKKHIASISKKYILPEFGTLNFALMYVPSEAIYYEIIRNESDLEEYARDKRVYIVSPNSFYYFLKVIMVGLEGQKIEENAKKVFDSLLTIKKQAQNLEQEIGVVNTHISNAKTAIDRVGNESIKLNNKIDNIKSLNKEDK